MTSRSTQVEIVYARVETMTIYEVTDQEIAEIKRGSAESHLFAFGLASAGLFVPTLLSIFTIDPKLVATRIAFIAVAAVSGIAAAVLLGLWSRQRKLMQSTIDSIEARRPPVGIQIGNSSYPPALSAADKTSA